MYKPIVVEAWYDASPARVWQALTVKEDMVQWFFEEMEDFQPVPGFTTGFSVYSGGREFRQHWEVTEVVPERRIAYEWGFPDYPGDSRIAFELEEEKEGTRLRVLCWGIETYPQDIPEFSRESCKAGWEYFLQDRLKNYLGKK